MPDGTVTPSVTVPGSGTSVKFSETIQDLQSKGMTTLSTAHLHKTADEEGYYTPATPSTSNNTEVNGANDFDTQAQFLKGGQLKESSIVFGVKLVRPMNAPGAATIGGTQVAKKEITYYGTSEKQVKTLDYKDLKNASKEVYKKN